MQYMEIIAFITLLLKFQLTESASYNCSDFDGHAGPGQYPMVACPPAKFMLENNLLECYDNYSKYTEGMWLNVGAGTYVFSMQYIFCIIHQKQHLSNGTKYLVSTVRAPLSEM